MFYVANVIPFRVFLELMWKSNFLVRYKLNRFQPPQVNHFDICAQIFGGYARFIPLDKIVLYGYWKHALWDSINVTFSFDIVSVV